MELTAPHEQIFDAELVAKARAAVNKMFEATLDAYDGPAQTLKRLGKLPTSDT